VSETGHWVVNLDRGFPLHDYWIEVALQENVVSARGKERKESENGGNVVDAPSQEKKGRNCRGCGTRWCGGKGFFLRTS